jgi:hypothetical protein
MLLEKPCGSSTITIGTFISRSMETVLCAADSQVVLGKSTATWCPSKRPSAPEDEHVVPILDAPPRQLEEQVPILPAAMSGSSASRKIRHNSSGISSAK